MATATGKAQCCICRKEKASFKCGGCSQEFCFPHLTEHRQILGTELNEVENDRNILQETLVEQKKDSKKHLLIQQINRWEYYSIQKIKQTAEECRQISTHYTNTYINEIENKLMKLTDEIQEIRQENDFNEIILNELKGKLRKLKEELDNSGNISIQHDGASFIDKISVISSSEQLYPFNNITSNTIWKQNGITIIGGTGKGSRLNQLFFSEGICVDDDQNIYIADRFNHRVVEWKYGERNGRVVAGGNGYGRGTNQLNEPTDVCIDKETDSLIISDWRNKRVVRWPRQNGTSGETLISDIECWGLAMDNNGYLYVADTEKHAVRRWRIGDSCETIVAGGNGSDAGLHQLNTPSYIFVDEDHSVYVSDCDNYRVVKWMKDAKEGVVVAGGNGKGNLRTQLSFARGVIVDHLDQIYVVDRENQRVMRWGKGATHGHIILGGNGKGEQSNQFSNPIGLSFDRQGNLYVADRNNYRIQKFETDSN